MTDLLRIADVTVRHGATVVLDDLSLAVRRDELFVLLGASGSGKTTLLRAIAGFVPLAAGGIVLDGQDIGRLPPHRRPVNTVFQSYALFPHMTVAANIAFGLRHMDRSTAAARVQEMLALVRLEALADRRPNQLSGGQQQRVALARGLAPMPAVLLLDEPLSALDRALRAETRDELVRLRRELGTSFILVTHDQQEALTMADRIGVMRDGRMVQVGTPAAVYEHPNCRFVAEFLGAANILPGVANDGRVDLPGLGVVAAPGASSGPMLLALRPERLRLGEGGANRLTGMLTGSVYAGETMTHTVRLSDGTDIRIAQSLHNGLIASPMPGAAVVVSWSPEACIVLPP
ncbi:MAG: ABC transporter ATP-binding protein [Rhodospirillales bacterium]